MILDGKALAQSRRVTLRQEIENYTNAGHPQPCLAVILVGEDPASQIYVRNKENACLKAGILAKTWRLDADTTQTELLNLIHQLNEDPQVNGILVQMPLPEGLDETAALLAISPHKDVDGLHPVNAGRLQAGLDGFVPCTPQGAMYLLEQAGLDDLSGKKAVVIGRSVLVGKPMAQLLLNKNATVTMCHSRTANLADEVRAADIVVAAVGKPHLIQGDWIKDGAIVIDVGINRLDTGKLAGDVDTEAAMAHASAITPVPGGCGPMTIQVLLENTFKAAKIQEETHA